MKNKKLIYLTFAFVVLSGRFVSAQTIEMSMVPDSVSTFKLDYMHLLISGSDQKIFTGNYSPEFKQVINEKINFHAEIPILYFDINGNDTKINIGNLFLGIQLKRHKVANVRSAMNLGVYLPTTSDASSQSLGTITNFFELPKYVDKFITTHIGYNSFHFLNNRFRIGFELDSDILIPIGDNNSGDVELIGKYGLSLMHQADKGFNAQLELLGLAILTEEGDFGEKTVHTYALGLGYKWNKVGIGVYYRNYFDDLYDFKGVLGTQLNIFP